MDWLHQVHGALTNLLLALLLVERLALVVKRLRKLIGFPKKRTR